MATKNPVYIEGEDGKCYMELQNPEDEIHRALNPTTGTETETQWPDMQPDVKPAALLDLSEVWENIMKGILVKTPSDDDSLSSIVNNADVEIVDKNAAIVVREIKYYLLASSSFDSQDEGEKSNSRKSTYGASILLKLQWEDRTVQKLTPKYNYTQLGNFINSIITRMKSLIHHDPNIAKPVLDTFSLDLTAILFARLLDGMETGNTTLETSAFNLLKLCAEHANPKEMHLGIMTFVKKIDSIYLQTTSYLVFDPLLRIWSWTILRIPRKRHGFLIDYVKNYERMIYSTQGWSGVPTDDIDLDEGNDYGILKEGRCDNVPKVAFEFYCELAKVQSKQRSSSKNVSEKVDELGRALPSFGLLKQMADDEENGSIKDNGNDNGKDNDEELTNEARDWVAERAIILARALKMQTVVWEKLCVPPGEDRNVRRKKDGKLSKEQEGAEKDLCKVIQLIHQLGWKNAVTACQVATKGLSLDLSRWEHEAIGNHIGNDGRRKKEFKYTLYSVQSVGHFLCGCLRPPTRKRLYDSDTDIDDYVVELEGTGFDMLQGEYAFDLTLPYIMSLIGQGSVQTILNGLCTLRAFFKRLPDGYLNGYEKVLEVRCGTRSMTRDISICGVVHQIIRSVGMMDDPRHRRFAYETFQMIIHAIVHPGARYSMLESVIGQDVERVAVQAQVITEMKDSIRYSDQQSFQSGSCSWNREQANQLKNRFVHAVLPRYLMPRKEMLGCVSAIVAVSNACIYIAGSDLRHLDGEGSENRKVIGDRVKWMTGCLKLGKECVRAIAAVAEHDRQTVPKWKVNKESLEEAKALYSASGRTLNDCVSSLTALDASMDIMKKMGVFEQRHVS